MYYLLGLYLLYVINISSDFRTPLQGPIKKRILLIRKHLFSFWKVFVPTEKGRNDNE